ncbi:Gamma-tubulin complex component 3 [Zea mays]|uniref:Gamma-tubulin complex component 3 n=1 Tax=Zea mays TaxID=4577 RepID=A0A1D6I5H6_MAIZE|nr:Gamma-tubulin complex component 3 [Zea mays]ONM55355.1 Gamma-tubulin complex component 3 [Zea mays]
MTDQQTQDLVKELVHRLLSAAESGGRGGGRDTGGALRFAHRILSSRLAPAVLPDEHALAESIKRRLAASGRPDDALSFADLHSKLSVRARPASLWPLLYLLDSLSSQYRAAAAASCLPNLPIAALPQNATSGTAPGAGVRPGSRTHGAPPGGLVLVSKDPDNIREIALREYTELVIDETEVSEAALVRDVLYACQGIDGRYVRYDKSVDSYDLPDGVRVPRSTRTLVRKLCELGWLFSKVRGFISDNISRSPSDAATEVGTVTQAFCSALQEELSDYYKLLAVLESYSLNPIPTPGSDSGVSSNYLSLRRLAVWLAEPAVRMRLMAVLVDGCRGLRGGAMAGVIHGHAQHGDPMFQEFMGRLLRRVCSPLFEMVRSWVLEGELEDVFAEFFIVGQPVKAESLWREGYLIQSDMLPAFISPVLAKRILRTGKSINFLRVCCDDSGWADAAAEAAAYVGTTTSRGGLGYGETDALEALVVEAAKRIDRHLMDVIHKRYRFKDHCLAIKRYLLLGQAKDLDDLLLAHDKYLNSILEKALLGEHSQGLLRNLFELFDIILQFRSHADRWFERIYELQLRGKGKSKSKDTGSWFDGGRKAMIQLAGELFWKMGEDLDSIAKDYTASLDAFITQLPMQQHVDLKFLLFRLDFTEYYSRVSSNK